LGYALKNWQKKKPDGWTTPPQDGNWICQGRKGEGCIGKKREKRKGSIGEGRDSRKKKL